MAQATNPKIEELRFRVKTDAKSRLFYPLAEELRKIGQFGEAEGVLRAGLEHHPTSLSGWVSLGRVLRDQKNDRAAVDVLTRALEGEPVTIVDLLGTDEGADIEFEPERLGLTARSAQL